MAVFIVEPIVDPAGRVPQREAIVVDPIAARAFGLNQRDRQIGIAIRPPPWLRIEVGEDHPGIDRPALRLVFQIFQRQARKGRAEVPLNLLAEMPDAQHDPLNALPSVMLEWPLQKRATSDFDECLRGRFGQLAEARALPATEDSHCGSSHETSTFVPSQSNLNGTCGKGIA